MEYEELKLETVELKELREELKLETVELNEFWVEVKVLIWVWRSDIWADRPAVATAPKIPTINWKLQKSYKLIIINTDTCP